MRQTAHWTDNFILYAHPHAAEMHEIPLWQSCLDLLPEQLDHAIQRSPCSALGSRITHFPHVAQRLSEVVLELGA